MKIGGVIIAGGRSTRMGREKALIELRGKPVIGRIIARVGPQVGRLAINANGDAGRYAGFGLPVIPDKVEAGTPLSGLHAALAWAEAEECEAVLTVPSDSPFLPHDLVARLMGEGAAVAVSGGQAHYLTGLWPTGLLPTLEDALSSRRHSRESGNSACFGAREKSGAPASAGVTDQEGVTPANGTIRVQDWAALCSARRIEWPSRPYDPFFNINTPDELAQAERIVTEFRP